ncbi:hypothetical protein [Actinomadura rudentiformis]|uniref:Uncharacterized protein n=1 Tax=Actinomadura rudentiformis TaxID=359158 RepID=A0A6H9Z5J0_9ACTN|nr:hypothetical protein [Actinomadura rudentiformis]KAB2350110.1 hypothetical protein F8566_09875 [Actinomadura rudentiformis]
MSTIEDRYRRLLAWYPTDHRSAHEQEMLDVLLSAARPGQTRPSVADAADLLYGAVRIRLRRAVHGDTGSAWPGALAIAGFLATLMLVADGVRFAVNAPQMSLVVAERLEDGEPPLRTLVVYLGTGPYWLAWAVIAFLAWRGSRRPAALAACAVTTAQVVLALYGTGFADGPWSSLAASLAGVPLPVAMLATASLIASPGLRHGARLLGRGRIAVAAAMATVLIALTSSPLFTLIYQGDLGPTRTDDVVGLISFTDTWGGLKLAAALATVVSITAVLSRTHQGRRACALLALGGAPLILHFYEWPSGDYPFLPGLLAQGLIGFALAMLCVRLVELSSRNRERRSERTPA